MDTAHELPAASRRIRRPEIPTEYNCLFMFNLIRILLKGEYWFRTDLLFVAFVQI